MDLDKLFNYKEGQDCYILACGPSLNKHDNKETRELLQNNLVFSIKQAYDKFKEETDFHFWNCSNLPIDYVNIPYRYIDHRPEVVVASSNYPRGQRWSLAQKHDIFFQVPLVEEIGGKDNTLAIKRNYDDFLITESKDKRMTGPGIMLETVLYMAVHVGVKSITTIGWDLDEHGSHFYKEEEKAFMDNKGCEIPWDIVANSEAQPSIKNWLQSKGIELNVKS
ncbi:hypothetical protein CMI37_23705 [Candidatus Pacearchaeota archaeon]|nr:hypothetical protein [Candidatus Pacearchaeota archaeon]|tara:strand:+ start:466 stop:1131 length:666 start_codon:yes stop_codon:yes gene_type:complete